MKKNEITKFPTYWVVPLLIIITLNIVVYCGSRFLTGNMYHHSLATELDLNIPFLPGFVVPYLLAYAQWGIGYFLIAMESKKFCHKYYLADAIAKIVCLLCFTLYPTTIVRPEIAGNGIFEQLTALVFRLDAPDNLFPSIHCLESYLCYRSSCEMNKISKHVRLAMGVMTILVFASTVLIKQHVLVDIIGGMLAVEVGLFISRIIVKGYRKNEE